MKPGLLGLVALLLSIVGAQAGELHLTGTETRLSLAAATEILEDPPDRSSIDEIGERKDFSPLQSNDAGRRKPATVWLRIRLHNASTDDMERWLEIEPGRFLQAALFVRQDGGWRRTEGGSDLSLPDRPLPTPTTVFPLHLAAGESQTVYLRLIPPGPQIIRPTLWQPLAFLGAENQVRLIHGSIFGGLLVTAVFGLILLFLLKDRAFAFNALATLSYCLGEASAKGYATTFLWPEAGDWNVRSLPIFALLGVGLNILFLRELLTTRARFPRLDRLLLALLVIQWLPAIGILFGDLRTWAGFSFNLHFPITSALALVGAYAMFRGVHAARYYTTAYLSFTIGSLLQVLSINGYLPGSYGAYALPLSMLLSNILMLASVVDRIILAQRDKEAAQDALLRIRTEQTVHLEQAVEERTAELHAALAETQTANQIKSRMIAFVGHDLRAPLATVISYIRLLGEQADPEIRRYQTTIERSALYQLEMIDELVEYARGELDHLELHPMPNYLYGWLQQLADEAELLARQRNNRLTLNTDASLPAVLIFDPVRLRQILLNLLGNAAKFTSDGEIRLNLYAETRSDEEFSLYFVVEDTGQGIASEDIEKVLQPFERGASDRAGYGLGLAIARQLVAAMGGRLQAESEEGRGSRFSFCLSLAIGNEADIPPDTDTQAIPEDIGAGKRVLVVDDDTASRAYLEEILTGANFAVVCSRDACAAIDLALSERFDLLLIDQMMPNLSGWEFLEQLHARSTLPAPAILCSALPPRRPAGYPANIAFSATLLKPVNTRHLLRTLRELIGQHAPSLPGGQPPAAMRQVLRRMVDGGSISDIEEWANALDEQHPEFATFADRVRTAARQLDFTELMSLSETG